MTKYEWMKTELMPRLWRAANKNTDFLHNDLLFMPQVEVYLRSDKFLGVLFTCELASLDIWMFLSAWENFSCDVALYK